MREGSLDAPTRHPIAWQDPDFYDAEKIDAEMRRVFDICHGCRRCFNLCDSFPRLFDLIDEAPTGELDSVDSKDFKPVVDACTLCDMCFMTKCPYVPPHEFNLDFPHLMLRYRAAELKRGEIGTMARQLTKTDRNGKVMTSLSGLANWASSRDNRLARTAMEKVADVHRDAELPKYARRTLMDSAKDVPAINATAPAHGRKAVLYATCFANYNNPEIGLAARAVLAQNGVETEILYPACCGMPQLEHGDLAAVAESARKAAAELGPWIDKGYAVVALVPSCALMMKFEWPLILPKDAAVKRLAEASFDISEYVVDIARTEGLADGLKPLDGGLALHFACHARAQNMGPKAAEMMRLIPEADVAVMERCSGHGGSWGVMRENFPTAVKVGRPVVKQVKTGGRTYLASECPLAGMHIRQGVEMQGEDAPQIETVPHPILLFARAYGLAIETGS